MENIDSLRRHLINLLTKAEAHADLPETLKHFPREFQGNRVAGSPHTPWQLLEHIRIAQWDILQFSINARHESPKFPDGYWPEHEMPPNDKAWDASVKQILEDLDSMCEVVRNPNSDLFAPIPHGDGQTLLREALLVADHNAYHLGQLVLLRRMLERE